MFFSERHPKQETLAPEVASFLKATANCAITKVPAEPVLNKINLGTKINQHNVIVLALKWVQKIEKMRDAGADIKLDKKPIVASWDVEYSAGRQGYFSGNAVDDEAAIQLLRAWYPEAPDRTFRYGGHGNTRDLTIFINY